MKDRVLIMACGGRKRDTAGGTVRAIDLYAGRQFEVARRMEAAGWLVVILSAEHGFVPSDRHLAAYNTKMTPAIARAFIDEDLHAFAMHLWTHDAAMVVFYGGETYFRVFEAIGIRLGLGEIGRGCEVVNIVGAGCGEHFSVLKEIAAETGADVSFSGG